MSQESSFSQAEVFVTEMSEATDGKLHFDQRVSYGKKEKRNSQQLDRLSMRDETLDVLSAPFSQAQPNWVFTPP